MRKLQNLTQLVKTKRVQALSTGDQLKIKGGTDILIVDNLGG